MHICAVQATSHLVSKMIGGDMARKFEPMSKSIHQECARHEFSIESSTGMQSAMKHDDMGPNNQNAIWGHRPTTNTAREHSQTFQNSVPVCRHGTYPESRIHQHSHAQSKSVRMQKQ